MTKSGTGTALAPIRILWMDDKPDNIENYKEILARENEINIEIATSIDEAAHCLKGAEGELNIDRYMAFIVDCQMDPYDMTENGAQFLTEINQIDKSFPTFVFSAWSQDPRYKKFLDQSYAQLIEPKTGGFEHPLLQNQFFKTVYEVSRKFREVRNFEPEKISYSDYIQAPNKYTADVEAHWKKHGHWITKDLQRARMRWGVVCGEEVVEGSSDLFDYPNEEALMKIGEAHNLIPFAYSEPVLPEDSSAPLASGVQWSTTKNPNDYYPSIKVRIGSIELQEDFDTGAEQTILAEELVKKGLFNFLRDYTEDSHLGESYEYLTKQVEISIIDSSGGTLSKELPVAVVRNWVTSPFTKINDKRRALLGRDLLRAFKVEVCLDSQNRITRVRFLP